LHAEKNLIDLEDPSDIDSSAESDATEKFEISFSDDGRISKPVDPLTMIYNMNK
jgi:hypothetical protein